MKRFCFLALLAFLLGLAVRLPYILASEFALNDGALFVQMASLIQSHHYSLPGLVAYNQILIPFAYPPLAFYLFALTSDILNINLLTLARYFPLVFNLACIVLFSFLAVALLKKGRVSLIAALIFPLLPKSYEWLIMGGGITRSVGFFFALLALLQMCRIRSQPQSHLHLASGCFLLALTWMSHLEWGLTASVTMALLAFQALPIASAVRVTGTLALGAALLASPWWFRVLHSHGWDPFLAAAQTAEWDHLTFERWLASSTRLLAWPQLPATLFVAWGSLIALHRRQGLIAIWLPIIFITTPRHGPTAATMPIALLAGFAFAHGVLPLAGKLLNVIKKLRWTRVREQGLRSLVYLGAAIYAFLSASGTLAREPSLHSLQHAELEAFFWLRENTHPEASFVILSDSFSWQDDRIAEWFPLLTQRFSLTTAQGLEWKKGRAFHERARHTNILKKLQRLERYPLVPTIESLFVCHDHLAVFGTKLITRLSGEWLVTKYKIIYQSDGVLLLKRHSGGGCV